MADLTTQLSAFLTALQLGVVLKAGNGSPETAVVGAVGSLYLRLDGGTSTTLYVKETGTSNTGWIAK